MFQLDDNFLQDLGLDNLPADQKHAFLQHIYEELELRVGARLAEGVPDEKLIEFESLITRDPDHPEDFPLTVADWLKANVPDFRDREDFQRFVLNANATPDDLAVQSEYAATKWLEINRPDYRQVVAEVLDQLKAEIISNRDSILGSKDTQ